MALSPKHVQDVCLIHRGYIGCRYVSYDHTGGTFLCSKLYPALRDLKDESVAFNEQDARRVGLPVIDYFDLHHIGHEDNCQGYRHLRHVQQGYDVP